MEENESNSLLDQSIDKIIDILSTIRSKRKTILAERTRVAFEKLIGKKLEDLSNGELNDLIDACSSTKDALMAAIDKIKSQQS